MSAQRIGDLERRLANMQRPGKVVEVDHAKARIKVQCGQNTTAWLPWQTGRAGAVRRWSPPSVGEQVLVMSPSGEMAQGYVLPGVYQNDHPANGETGDTERTDYADGASVEYDHAAHKMTFTLPEAGSATTTIGGCAVEQTKDGCKLSVGGASIELKEDGITLTVGGNTLTLSASGVTTGKTLTVTAGDVVATAVSLKAHTHTAVQPGSGFSGAPVQ